MKKQVRNLKDLELVNVAAVLPGTDDKGDSVSGADTKIQSRWGRGRNEDSPPSTDALINPETAKVDTPAPRVKDDGSGTATALELE